MSLISVDLPEPLGPSSATCSPCRICSVKFRSTVLSPRVTVTRAKSINKTGIKWGGEVFKFDDLESNIAQEWNARFTQRSRRGIKLQHNFDHTGGFCILVAVIRPTWPTADG